MSEKKISQNQSFFKGTLILTISIVIVKVIGAVFKIPLNMILRGDGTGYFSSAYELYSPLEALATAGFPIAISRLVSEYMAKGRYRDVRLIHRISIPLFLTTGTISFFVMIVGSFLYVKTAQVPGALYSVLALSPTVLFVCLMSIYRGYYQGLRNMVPTAVSEIIEAVCKLIIGLSAAFLAVNFIKVEDPIPFASAAAILGVTLGAFLGFLYLVIRYKRFGDGITKDQLANSPRSIGARKIIRQLVRIAVPIGIGAVVMNTAGLIDSTIILRRINDIIRTNPQVLLNMYAENIPSKIVIENKVNSYLYGCFGYVTTITMIVPSLAQAFGISALPSVTTAWAKNSRKQLKKSIETVLRFTAIVTIPAGMALTTMGSWILKLIYSSKTAQETSIASGIITVMGLATIFTSMSTPICSMLQAIGRVDLPVKLLSMGVIMKIFLNYTLVGIPEINIQGAGVGTLFCYFFVTVMALYYLLKETNIVPNFVMVFLKPFLAAVAMCIIGNFTREMVSIFLPFKVATLISLVVSFIIYVLTLFLLKGITKLDILMIPKGEKIVRVLEKYHWIG